jgi:hypothetical protein
LLFTPDEIAALVFDAASRCRPPMDPREVQAVLRSASNNPARGLGLEVFEAAGFPTHVYALGA